MTIEITLTHVLSAIGAILALYSVLYSRFGVELRLTERISAVEVKVGIWMKLLEGALPKIGFLVQQPHPEYERMDNLIEKFVDRGTSITETYELRDLLRGHTQTMVAQYEREKQDAVTKGEELPSSLSLVGMGIVATSVFSVAVEARIFEHEQRTREIESRKHHSWMRWLFGT